ncbi:lysis protein [Rodentibacter caecimuris]|uniref:Lysis protein n=1 Tax=Rodentibacter caecimuris TaxID=1796644 RepID=A0AAJ3K4A3_9PAST|nr:holin [Rodentibacter heylii]OOF70651.1 lysis protein [Rodentibacter heylii]OOF76557.1 lysis protein [Rodentibacter heylii]OOF78334.1 lysis protein [Rodentibacter heylii]
MHETTTKTAYTGAFTSFIMGRIADMFANINWADVASVVGIVIAVATFLINWYYKKKDFELRKLEVEGKINDKKNR